MLSKAEDLPADMRGTARRPEGPHPTETTPDATIKAPPKPAPKQEQSKSFG